MASRKSTAQNPAPETKAPAAADQEKPAITIVGRLTRDPQLRSTSKGLPVCNIRVAINHEDAETEFRTCVCWSRTAENVAKYLKTGRLVEVTGREVTRTWTGRDGQERSETELNAFRVQFVRSQPQAQPADKQVA